jgi:hypothetical protein
MLFWGELPEKLEAVKIQESRQLAHWLGKLLIPIG